MPLYLAGLWLAVNIAPGMSSDPEAKYSRSVEPNPASMTSAPCERAPSAKARASPGEVSRMSCAVTTDVAPTTRTKAAPKSRASDSLSSSGTTPRMSYALTIAAKFRRGRSGTRPTLTSVSSDLLLGGAGDDVRELQLFAFVAPAAVLTVVAGREADRRSVGQRHREHRE